MLVFENSFQPRQPKFAVFQPTDELNQGFSSYEGAPTREQVARAEVLGRELENVIEEFSNLGMQQLPSINQQLQSKKLLAFNVISEQEWKAKQE